MALGSLVGWVHLWVSVWLGLAYVSESRFISEVDWLATLSNLELIITTKGCGLLDAESANVDLTHGKNQQDKGVDRPSEQQMSKA